ncbi:eukaryotic cytochrome b561-domain-containing protein [Amylocarpus encephaloides]|uniref:Eukaryotic cytochrome b561-domain-containing protein n=1 Tax=Amylocarpus encephaloides TaxID=45428 RepID=A0A9P7YJ37_9HELO|nr:eukaryotic cytochrome b561-domain-containing protein [Amylocarpus encephaloides]
MASATGIPENILATNGSEQEEGRAEDEPLLGRRGDVSQQEGKPLYQNVFMGTAVIAQAGILLLTASVWANVLLFDLMLFSAHPLLNSVGILALTEAILVLQPTHTPQQKRQGTIAHFTLMNVAFDTLIAGLVVIEYNKGRDPHAHFKSAHAYLGVITYILLVIQALIGFTAYFVPRLYGGVENAKSLYKYHRMSGYVILVLLLVTVCLATQIDFVKTIGIKLWAVLVCSILILIGVVPRIKKHKFGFTGPKSSGAFGQ